MLSQDQQESYAPNGVYPKFAFTPDDSAIVIWAQGKLFKIDVKTAVATEVLYSQLFVLITSFDRFHSQ